MPKILNVWTIGHTGYLETFKPNFMLDGQSWTVGLPRI